VPFGLAAAGLVGSEKCFREVRRGSLRFIGCLIVRVKSMKQYRATFVKGFDFNGRASRKEYWIFTGVNTCISLLVAAFDVYIGWFSFEYYIGAFSTVLGLILLIPSFAVTIRRFHDFNCCGWWWLTFLMPVVGLLLQIIFMSVKGDSGRNIYGEDPIAQMY